mgnify:CR=1 FL=1
MDPEILLTDILDFFDKVSDSSLDERDLADELWDLKYVVSDYSDWIKEDGYSPNFQNVVKEWLTNKESQAYSSPAKNNSRDRNSRRYCG